MSRRAPEPPGRRLPRASRKSPRRTWTPGVRTTPTGCWHAWPPDVVCDDSAWPVTMRGHDDVRHFLARAWRAFPDMRFEIIEGPYRLGKDKAALWWRGTGTMTGPLDPPGFAPPARSGG